MFYKKIFEYFLRVFCFFKIICCYGYVIVFLVRNMVDLLFNDYVLIMVNKKVVGFYFNIIF